jgi:hypothetical protein
VTVPRQWLERCQYANTSRPAIGGPKIAYQSHVCAREVRVIGRKANTWVLCRWRRHCYRRRTGLDLVEVSPDAGRQCARSSIMVSFAMQDKRGREQKKRVIQVKEIRAPKTENDYLVKSRQVRFLEEEQSQSEHAISWTSMSMFSVSRNLNGSCSICRPSQYRTGPADGGAHDHHGLSPETLSCATRHSRSRRPTDLLGRRGAIAPVNASLRRMVWPSAGLARDEPREDA